MPVIATERLVSLQKNAQDIRNICILAHVDHGKTSLSDALIATNGIISPKMAGKIRYLDSRPDEQQRGITMESSAISLLFSMSRKSDIHATPQRRDYLINLIDSPGHVDFSSEVSTASRLCDGAVILVDAVEGVCSQTVTVLRQTWTEQLKPLLVINKIDRLITELRMTPAEAYVHLNKLLEQVNAVLGSFFQGERMEEDLQWREKIEARIAASVARERMRRYSAGESEVTNGDTADENIEFEERDDESLYFAPEHNNVIFSSAIDGWAFTISQFAALYEKKLGIKRSILQRCLWGDFYLDPRTKRVLGSKHLKGRALKPMFVQLVLDNIWAVYEATMGSKGKGDPIMLEKITKSLNLTIPPHVLRSRDPRVLLTTVFSAWLPLSTALLVSVIEHIPDPSESQSSRLSTLIDSSPGATSVDPKVRDAMVDFKSSDSDPIVAYVSKMVSIPARELPQNKRKAGSTLTAEEARELARKKRAEIAKVQQAAENEGVNGVSNALNGFSLCEAEHKDVHKQEELDDEPEQLVGFARLYSGTLHVGEEVYVLPPKFNPTDPHATPEPKKVTITALYLLMGRGLEALSSVPAGVVFGIGGLEGHILKTGTICSQLEGGVNLAGVSMGSQPIVRVALEPENPSDLGKMIHGMKLLEQSDPCARYEMLRSGEHVILTAGELHLERCLKDLRERYARCEIQAGEPIVPYRESIIRATEMVPPKNKDLPRGTVIGVTTSKQITTRLRVRPLLPLVTEYLEKHVGAIRRLYSEKQADEQKIAGGDSEGAETVEDTGLGVGTASDALSMADFRSGLAHAFKEAAAESKDRLDSWSNVIESITAFGPKRTGPNILVDTTRSGICQKFLQEDGVNGHGLDRVATNDSSLTAASFSDKISYAFQLACAQGPLCYEPIQGMAVFLEEVSVDASSSEDFGRLTGEVIKTVRESIRQGFLDWSPRIMLAMYSCEIQASAEVLGRVYSVMTRRRGRIISETLKEGTPFFTIEALLPVAESFGFSEEIRKRTSGSASPQMRFQGFEMLDEDPFWVPNTEEELEDLGELADRENVAKRYMDGVRRRKGLFVKERGREAEKQKTLKKN